MSSSIYFDPTNEAHHGFNVWKWYCGNIALVTILCLVPVWIKTALHQYHNYDLGIFAQALQAIRLGDLNPFIPALNIDLFGDHFDPILIIVSPLGKILEPAYAALIVEHLLFLLMPLPIVLASCSDRKSNPFACFSITYLLFNRGIMSAIAFPVHPTTWAAFFMVVIGVCVNRKRWGWLLLASILLMACKEEFPFVIMMVGIGLTYQKRFRIGVSLIAIALFWMLIAFGVRPWLLENTNDYASRVLSPLLQAPVTTIWDRLRNIGEAKRFFQSLLPIIPIAYWLLKQKYHPNWIMVMAALPLLAIRFLDGAWGFHYLAPVAPALLLSVWHPCSQNQLPWRYAAIGIIIAVFSASGPVNKAVADYAKIKDLNSPRVTSINEARSHLLLNADGSALVQGNLSPLLAKRSYVYQIGGVQSDQPYRFFFAEKPPFGDPWPLLHPDIDRLISKWRSDAKVTVLKDDPHIFLAERPTFGTELPKQAIDSGQE